LDMTKEAEAAISKTSSGLCGSGYYTPVIVLMAKNRAELEENSRLVAKVVEACGFQARVETVNTMEAWLGSLPGHTVPNIRRPVIHTDNFADLLPLASVWAGAATCPCPYYPAKSPPLLYGVSSGGTPCRINLHVGDVAHSLIFGPTGKGKTTGVSMIALQALRYPGMQIWSFDYKRGMLATVKACRGQHYDIAGDQGGPTFCPLSVLETDTDRAWAEDWIATCYELQTGGRPTPAQRDAIHKAMMLLSEPNGERTMTHFVSRVQDEHIRAALRYYTLDGTMGRMLDAEQDSVQFGRFIVFEMEDLLAMKEQAAIPVLLYLFRRFEKSLDGKPSFLILDEAWTMLGHPVFKSKIQGWLRLLRSKNCGVIMATQSLSDAVRSGLMDVLVESCPTKIFLPNDQAHLRGTPEVPGPYDFYRALGMNDTQIELIRSATPKQDYYLTSPAGNRLFQFGLGPIALSFAGATSREAVEQVLEYERRYGDQWAFRWLEDRGAGVQHEHVA
jgi:type IV secretion system protein TrbE